MAFRLIIRGSAPRLAIADYECPLHGRFEAQVERDEHGDPPNEIACGEEVVTGMTTHPITGAPVREIGYCEHRAEYRISAPLTRVRKIEAATKGGWTKPERPEWQDTRNLAEGQPLYEFWEDRARIREEERKREVMEFARFG
jgi:hypothetical protein